MTTHFTSDSGLTRARLVLKQAVELRDKVREDIQNRRFGGDDLSMEMYNKLLLASAELFPDDPILNGGMILMPDAVVQSYGTILPIQSYPPELASTRLEMRLSELINRIALVLNEASSQQPASRAAAQQISRTVFIIHGRDEVNMLRLERLLTDHWQIDVRVLREQPGRGRTLIEKFEEEAQTAAFSIALLTPDDLIEAPDGRYSQARPNVVFELGWFCGRLGRAQTCILFKRGTKLHSDLEGISRIEFSDSVEEKVLDIERELKAAGLIF